MRQLKYTTQIEKTNVSVKEIRNSQAYIMRAKLNAHKKLSQIEKNWLTKAVNACGELVKSIVFQGWKFDFSDVLKPFRVRINDNWVIRYATDKIALLRALGSQAQCIWEGNL